MREIVDWIREDLGAVFRHLLPGILIISAAYARRPSWFAAFVPQPNTEQLLLLAATCLAIGNLAYAVNRYGVLHFAEFVVYLVRNCCLVSWVFPLQYARSVYDEMNRFYDGNRCKLQRLLRFRDAAAIYLLVASESAFFASYKPAGFLAELQPLFWIVGVVCSLAGLWVYAVSRCIVRRNF